MERSESERAARGFRAGIMGASLHTGNRGVSALGSSVIKLLSDLRPDARISLLIGNRKPDRSDVRVGAERKSVETVNYRLSPRAPLGRQLWWIVLMSVLHRLAPAAARRRIAAASPWVREVVEADFVGDIRGGDSFSDIYGTKQFLLGCIPVLCVISIRRSIHLLPQTYGPFTSAVSRRMARFILLRAQSILCRDRVSLQEISCLTAGQCEGAPCPDVAFALEAVLPDTLGIEPPLPQEPGTVIGLNVNGLVYHGGYTKANMFGLKLDYPVFLTKLVEYVLSEPSNRILVVPHTFAPRGNVESDPDASRHLIGQLPAGLRSRVHLLSRSYDQHEIKGVIGMCDFFIGSRMHACIAALSQGIPTVAVAYSRKFAGVFETVGAEGWVIDGRTAGDEEGVARVAELFRQRSANRTVLAARVSTAQNELRRAFEKMITHARHLDEHSHERRTTIGGRRAR